MATGKKRAEAAPPDKTAPPDKIATSDKTAPLEEELSFAKALKMLEETVKSLESGELSLEDSLAKFEEGIKLARRLEAVLDRAEQKVKEILNPDGAEPKE